MTSHQDLPRKLWEHPNPQSTALGRFKQNLAETKGLKLPDYHSLYQWSISNISEFFDFLWKYSPIIHEGRYERVFDEHVRMDSIPEWFPGIRLNFAENVLFTATPTGKVSSSSGKHALTVVGKEDDKVAVTEIREGDVEPAVDVTWCELRKRTGKFLQALKAAGIQRGDRVAVVASNSIETLLVFLATTALGAIFSSASTDTGVKGILDRLAQIKPRWVFMDDFAVYNGKTIDLRSKMASVAEGMTAVNEFQGIVSIPRFRGHPARTDSKLKVFTPLAEFLAKATSDELQFEQIGFREPLMIAFSSGTTGDPKCIVHSVGGVVLNVNKEGRLNRSLNSNSVTLQYTTTGWIMYLTCVSGLICGAKAVLYDGSPFLPDVALLIRLLGKHRYAYAEYLAVYERLTSAGWHTRITHFGVSPRWMHEMRKHDISPRNLVNLDNLVSVTSTGMVLSDSLYEWFYDQGFPSHTLLANISGGTDIAASFALENPISPLFVGGCQGPSLGVAIAAFQHIEGGQLKKGFETTGGEPGELVATKPFPSMPVKFWGDQSGKKYFDAYFAKYDNVWSQGDFITISPVTHQVTLLGRSDGVLNPSGVRFGSAEIYNILESEFSNEIAESICVGQRRPTDVDESVMLFVQMRAGCKISRELIERIQFAIRNALSARHVPKYIFETPAIPVTVNLKKVELPVKQIVSGKVIKPSGTLLNPESLTFYYQFVNVEQVVQAKAHL